MPSNGQTGEPSKRPTVTNALRNSSLLRRFVDLLLYGHFWIAAAALAMSVQTRFLLSGEWSWSPLDGFVAAGTLTIYALHRLVAMYLSGVSQGSRFLIMEHYRWHIIAYAGIAAVITAYFYFQLSFELQLSLLVPNLIALAYILPLLNGRRLRDLPYVKIFLIALAWAWITVVAPAQSLHITLDDNLLAMAGERAFFIFAITIPFDIRDLALDQGAQVDTLPGIWGIVKAKKVALAALFIMLIFVGYNYGQGTYTIENALALLLSIAISALLIFGSNPRRHDYYYTGLLDGTMIMQAVLVIVLG